MTAGSPLDVLILGGTAEGRELAFGLAQEAGIRVLSSLAGRTAGPVPPAGSAARAAGELGLPIVVVRRPPEPDVPQVTSSPDAVSWVRSLSTAITS